eukprot:CAMPEP_0180138852 /NCGR_PEP_ID=MMETSP0986-20121125/13158_1 /TAXON_ID=697907 /ORGANISM="non described non described, Strain CCMP2293" /LENGTH=398 /DNA_ID=CAMNT_0022080791 /DNA_START=131 /DNA_END=1327 /DNA_ORIENTATION=-
MSASQAPLILKKAIKAGVPLYNSGNTDECFRVYRTAALDAIKVASPAASARLLRGVTAADQNSDASQGAWALRDAFDEVIAAAPATADRGDSRGTVGMAEVQRITRAIEKGVPLFNQGNPAGCADEYESALKDISDSLSGLAKDNVDATLRTLPTGASERAWALRRTMDALLSRAVSGDQDDTARDVPRGIPATTLARPSPTNPSRVPSPPPSAPPLPEEKDSSLGGFLGWDFSDPAAVARWRSMNDVVMGGRSSGSLMFDEDAAQFVGVLSEQNNGGFSSVRADGPFDLAGRRGLEVRFQGDGQIYKLQIQGTGRAQGISYQADFQTEKGLWKTEQIPFARFRPTVRGRAVPDAPAMDGNSVGALGFMISKFSDGGGINGSFQAGAFRLAVKWLRGF